MNTHIRTVKKYELMLLCTVHIGNGNFHKHFVFQNSARGTGPRRVFIRNGKNTFWNNFSIIDISITVWFTYGAVM